MNVWLINPYGPVPREGWRDYRFTLAGRALARRGHDVTWWTAAFAHHTKTFRSGESERVSDGFTVRFVPTPAYRSHIGLKRLWFEAAFSRHLFDQAKSLSKPDVIIAADPPQFCGAVGRRLAAHFHVPLVIDCLDLWPELFIRVAPAPLRPFVRAASIPLFALRRRNLGAADLIIAVADSYRRAVTSHTKGVRSVTVPIGVDLTQVPLSKRSERDGIIVVYAGSLGEAYDLPTVLAAAELMKSEKISFVIAGTGPAEKRLRAEAAAAGLGNVRFAGTVPSTELPTLYHSADIAIAPYAKSSTVAIPLKFFDYLAAGLPVVTSLRGEGLDLLAAADAGISYDAGDADSLASSIRRLAVDEALRVRMSAAARKAADQFDARTLYETYADAVESVIRK